MELPIKEQVMIFRECRKDQSDEVAALHLEAISDMIQLMRIQSLTNSFSTKSRGRVPKWRKNFRALLEDRIEMLQDDISNFSQP